MQQNKDQVEEELNKIKDILHSTEKERDNALEQLRSIKQLNVEETGMKLHEDFLIKKFETMNKDLKFMKEELKNRDKLIESLKLDIEKVKKLEIKLAEKSTSVEKLKEELSNVNTQEALAMELLSEGEKRIRELEAEVEKGKQAEAKIYDSLLSQTKDYEKTKIMLEEAKLETTSLNKKIDDISLKQDESKCISNSSKPQANIDGVEKVEKFGSFEDSLKNELKRAAKEEENSKKALDDLALALKEVGIESNKVKETLGLTKAELEYSKGEEERLKFILKDTEEKYKSLLDEAKKETELHKNTAMRLRVEAEESLVAWTGKEAGFVECIKRAEKDFQDVQKENSRLLDCLYEAENETKTAKEETSKLRDILRQGLNEANVSKEAALIAREENSQLKDTIIEKEETINFLIQENQNYKMHETAALESINELKRLLFEATMRECHCKSDVKDKTFSDESKEDKEAGLQTKHKTNHSDELDHLDTHYDDFEDERNSRKKKALLRRFGDLIMKKGYHKKEPTMDKKEPVVDKKEPTADKKEPPVDKKEVAME